MITISKSAQDQIRTQFDSGNLEGQVLRLAAKPDTKGGIDYALGFDEAKQDDNIIAFTGFDVAISTISEDLLDGVTLDFVEYKEGDYRFIFYNPNDPNHSPPNAD